MTIGQLAQDELYDGLFFNLTNLYQICRTQSARLPSQSPRFDFRHRRVPSAKGFALDALFQRLQPGFTKGGQISANHHCFGVENIDQVMNMKQSGERIQQLRIRHGYTQGELVTMLNIDRSFLSYVESRKKGCSVDLLVQLSVTFDVSLDYMVLGQEQHDILIAEYTARLKADTLF